MSTDKQKLIDERASIEAKVGGLRERRAGLAADLRDARAAFAAEQLAVSRALADGKSNTVTLAKLNDARGRLDVLPGALAEVDRAIVEASAPLAEVDRAIARLEVAEALSEAAAIVDRLKAATAAAYADYTRLCALGDALEGLKDRAGNARPAAGWVTNEIFHARGIGIAGEQLGQPRGDWVHGFEQPRPAPLVN